jgi:hypothetical protein
MKSLAYWSYGAVVAPIILVGWSFLAPIVVVDWSFFQNVSFAASVPRNTTRNAATVVPRPHGIVGVIRMVQLSFGSVAIRLTKDLLD